MSINTEALAATDRLPVPPLPDVMLEPVVRAALLEDLGRAGDLTTDAIVPADAQAETRLVARQEACWPGWTWRGWRSARWIRRSLQRVARGRQRAGAGRGDRAHQGGARAMLTAERVALNFLCHLSGVATATASIARAVAPYGARVTCTRKTMPACAPCRNTPCAWAAAAIIASAWTTRC